LTWMNERYLLACFGQRPFSDRVPHQKEAAAALTTVWINTLYGPPPATGQ